MKFSIRELALIMGSMGSVLVGYAN
eukprot:SAG11_NODE_32638_length_282_cov_0.508197_1_plen_24_part_01